MTILYKWLPVSCFYQQRTLYFDGNSIFLFLQMQGELFLSAAAFIMEGTLSNGVIIH
jgi:hypothetical protein